MMSTDSATLEQAPHAPPRFRMQLSKRADLAERRRREQELRDAMHAGEVGVRFNPRVSLATGGLGGAEAVLRWPRRRRGLVPAVEVAALAMQAGCGTALAGWMLEEACRRAVLWPGDKLVCATVPGSLAGEDAVLEIIAAALGVSGLSPDRLEIGIDEAAFSEKLEETLLRLGALRDLGVGVALDGFGAGATSLALLKRLPLTSVKLDAGLVKGVAGAREDRAIPQAVIRVAHALGLVVVATGVETDAQREALASAGCDAGQGPLFGLPFGADWPAAPPPG